MSAEPADDTEELIQYLGDRIEELERALCDDEDFCNRDVDATYQAAVKYMQSLEEQFGKKLQELKKKLDQVREENVKTSKQNRKQFDEETEVINQLFSSGKHQEAKQKLQDYEKYFEQRTTIIQAVPKLHMNELDVSRYFSFDKPLSAPTQPPEATKQAVKMDAVQPDNQGLHPQEFAKTPVDIRYKHSDNQQVPTHNRPTHDTADNMRASNRCLVSSNQQRQSPLATISTGPSRFSTRLASSSSNKSQSLSDSDPTTPPSAETYSVTASANVPSQTPVGPILSASSVTTWPNRPPALTMKLTRGEGLTTIFVAPYQYERHTSLLMASNKDHIILFKSQSARLREWSLNAIVRYNRLAQNLDWSDPSITSVGSIDRQNLYIFTDDAFIIYSLDSFLKVGSWVLPSASNQTVLSEDIKRGIGTVYYRYIYHISYNSQFHWTLSMFDLENMDNLLDRDLSVAFPDVQRYIHVCVNEQTVGFLVELDVGQYAAIFCSSNTELSMQSRRLIPLSYAECPLTICSVHISSLQRHVFFVNDPSAKIIHLLTTEKYLQSYRILAHSLCYVNDTDEVMFTSNDGIFSIRLKDQDSFFSKFH